MNEEHKKRGLAYSKTLMTAAICALFLSGGSVMVHAAETPITQEVQQTTSITITESFDKVTFFVIAFHYNIKNNIITKLLIWQVFC